MKKHFLGKIICLVMAVAMVLGLAACNNGNTPDDPQPATYTVTFDIQGHGTAPAAQKVKDGEHATAPSDPTAEGWTFGGWYKEKGCTNTFVFASEAITSDVTVYAKWTEAEKEDDKDKDPGNTPGSGEEDPGNTPGSGEEDPGNTPGSGEEDPGNTPGSGEEDPGNTPGGDEKTSYPVTFDVQGHGTAPAAQNVKEGEHATDPGDLTEAGWIFGGWYKEAECENEFVFATEAIAGATTVYAKWTEEVIDGFVATLVYNNGQPNGRIITVKEYGEYYFDRPSEDPEKLYHTFKGWYTDEECTHGYNFDTVVTDNITLYAKFEQAYDRITTEWDFLASASILTESPSGNVALAEDTLFQGKFLLGSGARFEIGSQNCINTQNKTMEFVLSGEGAKNTVTFKAKWASGSTGNFTIIDKETGEVKYNSGSLTNGSASFDAEVYNLPAGRYAVVGNGSVRFYSFKVVEDLPQGPVSGLELNTASVDKYVMLGRAFSINGLSASLVYENGRRDVLSNSDLQIKAPDHFTYYGGEKTIEVTYLLNGETPYRQTYSVFVCEVEQLVCYDYTLSSDRKTRNLQTLFGISGTFNHDNLVVKAKCLKPSSSESIEFMLYSNEYKIDAPTLDTCGTKVIGITYVNDLTKYVTYNIEVCTIPNFSQRTEGVTVTVDPEAMISTTGNYNFHTINDALQFLKLTKVPEKTVKTVALKKNTVYKEKVEIDIKNVVLTTDGVTDEEISAFSDKLGYETAKNLYDSFAVIEYNALSGILDPSETITHSTDGSATVSIRPEAENFTAKYVTFKNYYNTNALYNESLLITKDSQAVAALVQADKASFIGCKFTSYHDTLYAQINRQYYSQCLIEGHTDYIFGYNATAYFGNCVIRSIGAGATKEENGSYNNGGYVVATKGFDESIDKDAIVYGYIFDGCDFTGDEKTADGSVSIARGWGDNMRIMVMNSTLDGKFSKEAYGEKTAGDGKDMNDRYGKMNAAPNAAYLLEYNNRGDGAVQASLTDTCTVLNDQATADVYKDFATIYSDGESYWNPLGTV